MKIVADMHTHTNASTHAYSSLHEMVQGAKRQGHIAIAITDHGPAMDDAPHWWHFGANRPFPHRIDGVYVLWGIEYNILPPNGGIDPISLEAAESLDYTIASFHGPCYSPADQRAHDLALDTILKNPLVMCFGHLGNSKFPFDKEKLISQCNQYGKIVEINNNSTRVRKGSWENCTEIAKLCAKYRVPIMVTSDAHSEFAVGQVDAALELVQSAGVPEELVINADENRLRNFLLERRGIDIFA
ncbi:phosphatase [Butyricicoccus porcorum]|uniref:Polymerase/histidinol phosphatase N-terminal domain-containing protein n=1 Tax=Butyricicoccus porcorum TaxID=1945634 RepID=A0A252F2F0_9FIRM|nr:phosphatase [Butyricicoccus porcorum]MCI6926793.1 phosphatase [Butyricicoccus porcorum]MDD6986885.1 phosphatase [Butyricicoccus porcorum]MDY4482770.1 phosphatase [Butyricicoccus porcorum]OUM19946.1 hypothetical protein CBW42_10735 [Butyricicoccus porcorum]